jgi:hypothetical protein
VVEEEADRVSVNPSPAGGVMHGAETTTDSGIILAWCGVRRPFVAHDWTYEAIEITCGDCLTARCAARPLTREDVERAFEENVEQWDL